MKSVHELWYAATSIIIGLIDVLAKAQVFHFVALCSTSGSTKSSLPLTTFETFRYPSLAVECDDYLA